MEIPLIIDNEKTNYIISSQGEIINKKTNKILNGTIRNGYKMVKLTINGEKKDYLVHRLVAQSFLPNSNNFPQVNHKDKNRLNNKVENLEWISVEENIKHRGKTKNYYSKKEKQEIVFTEDWKQYKNSNYWISKNGQCYNSKTKRFLTPTENGKYLKYCLCSEGKKFSILAHKMVYIAFYGDYDESKQINHIDGNTLNNNIDNLELITRSENMIHSYYSLSKNIIQIGQYDLNGVLIKVFPSLSEAARAVNGSSGAISKVCNGKAKTHKNFIWKKIV